jgi:hypothetical protein
MMLSLSASVMGQVSAYSSAWALLLTLVMGQVSAYSSAWAPALT